MREHTVVVKAQSMVKTQSGVSFIALCCGAYEESFHFERVGHYSTEELKAKILQSLARAQENHDHQLAGEEHLETLLKQFAEGVPNCVECG